MRLKNPVEMIYTQEIRGLKHRLYLIIAGLFGTEMTVGGYSKNIPKNVVDRVLEEYD